MSDVAALADMMSSKLHVKCGYDPEDSHIAEDTLVAFLRTPVTLDLRSVPGIGKVGKRKLIEQGITNTYNLIAKYLALRADDDTSQTHCDKFWRWIDSVGLSARHRDMIVHAIAEKVSTMMPGLYNTEELKQKPMGKIEE